MVNLNYTCSSPLAWIYDSPEEKTLISRQESQLLYGEEFSGSLVHKDWISGYTSEDMYQGYVTLKDMTQTSNKTHVISSLFAHIYPQPSFKFRPLQWLPFLSRVILLDTASSDFHRLDTGGWVYNESVAPIGQVLEPDWVKTALKFQDIPYLYGGHSIFGIDCSGLIRLSLLAAGIPCPRDSDRQLSTLPGDIRIDRPLQRGDIVFFQGHVVVMLDAEVCLNATARHMQTSIEPFKLIQQTYGDPKGIKRLD